MKPLLPEEIIETLDKVLSYCVTHTDEKGRVVVEGEIDCKDAGWLILAAIIRLNYDESFPVSYPLRDVLNPWTHAVTDVDDRRSAWTTMALLYGIFISGGRSGYYYCSLTTKNKSFLDRFVTQIDMRYLREASRNYRVAEGIINALKIQLRYTEGSDVDVSPNDSIRAMLECYCGNGFFNDDDICGSSSDRRIDAYSAEILGLLLHYDEICGWNSLWHERIEGMLQDFCSDNLYLIDSEGEYAKWGRSLRGEAEIKKVFLWQYAESHHLVSSAGDGLSAARAQFDFFMQHGISPEGLVYRDKGKNQGIWDEYTTHVQALGYAAYGLAMALRFMQEQSTQVCSDLPSRCESYLRHLAGPHIITLNNREASLHAVVPLSSRLTKNVFLWHNRLTMEDDTEVDMSSKYMPVPYFGERLPQPYANPVVPFLPVLRLRGKLFVPRNLDDYKVEVQENDGCLETCQVFQYCEPASFRPDLGISLDVQLSLSVDCISYQFNIHGTREQNGVLELYLYIGNSVLSVLEKNHVVVSGEGFSLKWSVTGEGLVWNQQDGGPSIYGHTSRAIVATLPFIPQNHKCSACLDISGNKRSAHDFFTEHTVAVLHESEVDSNLLQ